jgi:hypothetical protein
MGRRLVKNCLFPFSILFLGKEAKAFEDFEYFTGKGGKKVTIPDSFRTALSHQRGREEKIKRKKITRSERTGPDMTRQHVNILKYDGHNLRGQDSQGKAGGAQVGKTKSQAQGPRPSRPVRRTGKLIKKKRPND